MNSIADTIAQNQKSGRESAPRRMNTSSLVKISMLGAVSFVLMLFEFPLPVFPFFLQLDLSDLPAIVGTVALGPAAGALIELIKNLLHLFKTSTAGVGELANFLTSIALIIPIGLMYKRVRSVKGYIIGSVIGAALMAAVACVFNYYILIPTFARAFGTDIKEFVMVAQEINPAIVDLKTLVFFAIVPFNIIKAAIVAPVGYGVCKLLRPIFSAVSRK